MKKTIPALPSDQSGGTTAAKALAAIRKQLAEGDDAYERGAYDTAWSLWRPLADLGIAEAEHSLGVIYTNGAGVFRDPSLAAWWYRRAAEQGFAPAAFRLGVAYSTGDGVKKDESQAAHWKARAAAQGYSGPAPEPAGTAQGDGARNVMGAAVSVKPGPPAQVSFQSWHYPYLKYREVEKVRNDYERAGISRDAEAGQKRGD